MTEDEMKTKWCPHVRTVVGRVTSGISVQSAVVGNAYDAANRVTKETCCIGSACSQWRWIETPEDVKEVQKFAPIPFSPKGYCGLAGKP